MAEFLLENIRSLETLRLDRCYRLSDQGLVPLLRSCSDSFKSLTLNYHSRLGPSTVSMIVNLSHLRRVKLDNVDHVPVTEVESFLLNPKLNIEELSIQGLRQVHV